MENAQTSQSESNSMPLWIAAIVTAIAGAATSVYSVIHHMEVRSTGATNAACNINATVNCDAVALSKYAELFNIPLGVYGLGYFTAMAILAATVAFNLKTKAQNWPTWLLLSASGIVASLVLGIISLVSLNLVCIVCIVIYAITIVQAVTAYLIYKKSSKEKSGNKTLFDSKNVFSGLSNAGLVLGLVVGGFVFLKPKSELPLHLQDTPGKHDGMATVQPNIPSVEIPLNRTPYSGFGEDYRLGSDEAKVVITEFADYQCPACASAKTLLDELHKKMGNQILIVFKNYPLSNQCNSSVQSDMHSHSCNIARLARCAGKKGRFWEFHRKAFDEQRSASLEQAKVWGKTVGLSDQEMDTCLTSKDILAKIQDDVALGNKIGVDSTPTIFINGRRFVGGRSVDSLENAVRQELQK